MTNLKPVHLFTYKITYNFPLSEREKEREWGKKKREKRERKFITRLHERKIEKNSNMITEAS